MKAAEQAQTIKPLVDVTTDMLTPVDLLKLERQAQLKAELKKLDDELKPKVEATVKHFGAGTVLIGDRRVKLTEATRTSYSWKAIAHAVAPEDEINAVMDEFALEYTSYGAKVQS